MSIPHIVVVGGGAGGLELVTKLGKKLGKKNRAKITLIDQSSTHIWKPLLHEVAAGTLNATGDEENYFIHGAKHHYEFQLGSMEGINRDKREVFLAPVVGAEGVEILPARTIAYDYLVIAIGSTCNDFGTPGAKENTIFLDTRLKADTFHRRLLDNYIVAHAKGDEAADENILSIGIIGAGATGVELAAELHYASKQYVRLGLDEIHTKNVRITLIEAAPRILPPLSEKVAKTALKELQNIGVDVLTDEKVVEITHDEIKTASGKVIPVSMSAWCAGIKAPDFLNDLDGLETNRINQILVKRTLQTSVDDQIFAMGDCACCELEGGRFVPPRAQAAHQQASLLAKNIDSLINNKSLKEFDYNDHGSLVSLSQENSVGTLMGNLLGNVNINGFLAKMIYISLYRSHQYSVYGFYKTAAMIIKDFLGRSTGQRIKLH